MVMCPAEDALDVDMAIRPGAALTREVDAPAWATAALATERVTAWEEDGSAWLAAPISLKEKTAADAAATRPMESRHFEATAQRVVRVWGWSDLMKGAS